MTEPRRGRPPKGLVQVHARISPEARKRLERYMERHGLPLGEAVDQILRRLRVPAEPTASARRPQ